jgi:hypothetical protein
MNIFASEQQSNNISTLASTTWRLSPEAGAMAVGWDAANVGVWWSSSADDVTGRACLFMTNMYLMLTDHFRMSWVMQLG